ncbi:MAG: hypothetical protein ACRDLB_05065 [Actinomycetota bacterium]
MQLRGALPLRRLLVLLCLTALTGVGPGRTFAAFSSSAVSQGSTFTAARIFAGQRSTSAWDVRDSADGTESNESEQRSFGDNDHTRTKNWGSSYSANRYLEFDFNSPLPAGLVLSNAAFDFRFADDDDGTGNQFCYYLEVRRTSTGTVVATYGSPAAPISCANNRTMKTVVTPLPAVSGSDVANDITIRVYGMHSTGGDPARVDKANITTSVYTNTFTLFPQRFDDRANGTSAITRWGPAVGGDGVGYLSSGNWSNNWSASRYLEFTFPPIVPAGGVVTSVSIDHSYRSFTSGDTTCWILVTYDGTTFLATHGTTGAPVSCNSTTAYRTDTVLLPEVDSVAEANNLTIQVYSTVSGSRRTQHDLVRLNVTYSLPST